MRRSVIGARSSGRRRWAPGCCRRRSPSTRGPAIGEGRPTARRPSLLTNLAADPNNTQTIASSDGGPPFPRDGQRCPTPPPGSATTRRTAARPRGSTHDTSATFEGTTPDRPTRWCRWRRSTSRSSTLDGQHDRAATRSVGQAADHRPLRLAPEGHRRRPCVAAESDDNGKTWYFMQNVLELEPGLHQPDQRRVLGRRDDHRLPDDVTEHQRELRLGQRLAGRRRLGPRRHHPAARAPATSRPGQFLYLLDRNTNNIPGTSTARSSTTRRCTSSISDRASIATSSRSGTPTTRSPGNNDIKSISSTLNQHAGRRDDADRRPADGRASLNPDGIMAVFPTSADGGGGLAGDGALRAEDPRTATTPGRPRCRPRSSARRRPFSGKTNHDISNVRLATTTDGVHFTDLGHRQRAERPDHGRLQQDALGQPARHAHRHQRRRERLGPLLLGAATASTATRTRSTTSATPSRPTR